ncbi:acyl-CoA synthetase FdrA [Cryobacterium sp. PAMC25264]|uniref:acyl-CoA synthetase FdrA n=1 Tax=Cryobacterium sp. PAMC25264 TaxID=2861288 RepID=UPI001C635086|nr:acyl-CoA synthetase FdrA [Cryobacterium sp. PAMC25264]QYF72263.1 acyl-CoA synthetase FdrA [Cryobacterium sp. PAMC25264]
MTTQQHRVYANLYKDSVSLMAVSSALMAVPDIEAASVVMATNTNRENLRNAGLADVTDAKVNDLLVVVRGEATACEEALALADRLLAEQPVDDSGDGTDKGRPSTSLRLAVAADPSANLALISVPGPYAAAEALKALKLGLNAMIFSDNMPIESEVEVKRYATDHELLVMGPDCGTALINGIPLGFANVVRRGRIGVVGASGTGMQEITSRIHQLGAGVSQAIGTGGHDLSSRVGGLSTLHSLRALGADDDTDVIVLVSKPPAPEVASVVLEVARNLSTPVVVMFVGAGDGAAVDEQLHTASTLAEAADLAVALLTGTPAEAGATPAAQLPLPVELQERLRDAASRVSDSQLSLRGIYSGGTFCYEAQALSQAYGIYAHSNTPVAGNPVLEDIWTSREHTIIDMGDDDFTRGRPHPMIDPTLRDERLLAEAEDPSAAVLLFDVVLGYGAADDPTSHLLEVLEQARSLASAAGRSLPLIAHVCGTDEDPQSRKTVVAALEAAGVFVSDSNAQAAQMAGFLVSQIAASANSGELTEPGKK